MHASIKFIKNKEGQTPTAFKMPLFTKPKSDKPIISKRDSFDKQPFLFTQEKKTLKYCRMNSSASASLQETSSSFDTSSGNGRLGSEMEHDNDNADEHETRDDTGRRLEEERCSSYHHHNIMKHLSSTSQLDDDIARQGEVHHSELESNSKRIQFMDDEKYKNCGFDHKRRSSCITNILFGVGLGVPMLVFLMIFSEGISLLLQYRQFFGSKAPIPISPSHGVVAAIDRRNGIVQHDTCSSSRNSMVVVDESTPSTLTTGICRNRIVGDVLSAQHSLSSVDITEENYQFKTFVPSIHLSHSLQMKPLRLLVIGDSVARGVGQSDSFYPLMPETLGAILSKHNGGRPVFWSAFGEPGATMKWIARQVHEQTQGLYNKEQVTKEREPQERVSMEQFWKLHQRSNYDAMDRTENVTDYNGDDDDDDVRRSKLQWIEKLHYHQQLYEVNPFAGYDYIIALSGINDIKRMLVPFLVYNDDSKHNDNRKKRARGSFLGQEWGFGGDLRRLVRDLHKLSNFHSQSSSHMTPSLDDHHENLPLIIFPSFPAKHVPAKMGAVLRWIGVKLTGMLDAVKRRIADENAQYIYSAPYPDDQETIDFIHKVKKPGSLMDVLEENEIMIQLVHGNKDYCQQLVKDMKTFYSTRKAKQEDNMMASDLFSNDAVHPNDRGYDYFGRYLGKYLLQRWGKIVRVNHDDNDDTCNPGNSS